MGVVSVIIPAFNAFETLSETVASALNQSYPSVEVIVVDDGSTDDTASLFADFESKGVRCFTVPNAGAAYARNFGLSKAQGTYIQFLDADDVLQANKIQLQVDALQTSGASISYGDWSYFQDTIDQQNTTFLYKDVPQDHLKTGEDMLLSLGEHRWFIPIFCWLTRRESIEKAGRWNESLSTNDDGEFFARVLLHNPSVVRVPQVVGYYRRIPEESLSKPTTSKKITSALRSYDLITEHIHRHNKPALLIYPKGLLYSFFRQISITHKNEAKKVAARFDAIPIPIEITPKFQALCIKRLGLYHGYKCYKFLLPVLRVLK